MKQEQISALMDDELPAATGSTVIGQMLGDDEAQGAWGRYHLIGAALRSAAATGALAPDATAPRVAAPTNLIEFPRQRRTPLLALGLAATVAAVAVMVMLLRPAMESGASVPRVADNVAGGSTATARITSDDERHTAALDEYDRRLNSYLVNFNEQRARLDTPGVHPYVHIVGYEAP